LYYDAFTRARAREPSLVAGFQFQLLFATTTTTTTRITKTTQRRTSAGLEKQKQKQKKQKQKQKRKRPPQKHKKHNFFTHRVPVRVPRAGRHAKVKKDKLIERHFLVRLTKTQKQSATLLLVLLTRTELTPISIWYALLALFYRDIFYLASYLASWRVVVHVVCTRVPPTGVFFFSRERAFFFIVVACRRHRLHGAHVVNERMLRL
jgi:hypothetical protein